MAESTQRPSHADCCMPMCCGPEATTVGRRLRHACAGVQSEGPLRARPRARRARSLCSCGLSVTSAPSLSSVSQLVSRADLPKASRRMLSASRLLRRSSRLLTSDAKAPLALHGILSPLHEIGPISFSSFKSKPDKPWPSALRYYLGQRHWFDDTKSEQVRTAPNLRDAFAVAYSPTVNSWDGESSSGDPRQPAARVLGIHQSQRTAPRRPRAGSERSRQ